MPRYGKVPFSEMGRKGAPSDHYEPLPEYSEMGKAGAENWKRTNRKACMWTTHLPRELQERIRACCQKLGVPANKIGNQLWREWVEKVEAGP